MRIVALKAQVLVLMMALLTGCASSARIRSDYRFSPTAALTSPIHETVRTRPIAEIEEQLNRDPASINATTPEGWTPLIVALQNKRMDVAMLLIEKGARLNFKTKGKFTPLAYAILFGNEVIVDLMIKHGADVNTRLPEGWTHRALAHYVRKDAEPFIVSAGGKGDTQRGIGTLSLPFLSSIRDSDDNIMVLEYVVEPPDGINVRLYLYEGTGSGKARKFGSWMNMNDVDSLAYCARSKTGTAGVTHRGERCILMDSDLRGVSADYITTMTFKVQWTANRAAGAGATAYYNRDKDLELSFRGKTMTDQLGEFFGEAAVFAQRLRDETAIPVLYPQGNSYQKSPEIRMECKATNSDPRHWQIRYTTDGRDPSDESALYTAPITPSESVTIKARAFKKGSKPSRTVEESYIIHLESAGVPLVPEMVRVKAGKVSISAACGDISVARDFSIGTYPVTQDQFASVMGFNPSMFKGQGRGSHPVEGTTWFDAVMYCNKLSKAEGLKPCYSIIAITYYGKADAKGFGHPNSIESAYVSEKEGADGYRLPTRDEWVYAERGGSQSKAYEYSGSDNLDEVGWYWQNSGDEYLTGEDGSASAYISVQKNNNRTHPVGMKKPNELGIYGMSGHVEEWTGSAGHGWPEVRMYCGNSYWKPFYMIRLSERKRFLNRREARQYSGYSGFRIAR